jgi:mannosyltransferase OCH1-like enzyme
MYNQLISKKNYKYNSINDINDNNKNFPNKSIDKYKINIPANIFQTWHSKILPPFMYKNVEFIKKSNPGFRYHLFDDNDCRVFIKENFPEEVLDAYDRLIPGAYKADLWRYCILYIYGGIYLDIKYKPINNFKLINLLEEEHWTLDLDRKKIYNALLVCNAKNEMLLKAINQIVENVKNKYYGVSWLEPTGPALLKKYFTDEERNKSKVYHVVTGSKDYQKYIKFKKYNILQCYPGYFNERQKYSIKEHYSVLWKNKKIYL